MITSVQKIFICIALLTVVRGWEEVYDLDADLSLAELIEHLGYGLEEYKLTLSDGYIVSVYRIKRDGAENLKPILFVHGYTGCVDSYFVAKNNSPPIFFANHNYDIWLLSHRGTINSLGHTRWNSSTDREYWEFSWQEIGMVDLPAAIDLALSHNRHSKVALIGHSEGSIIVFVTLSEVPQYNEKVAISFHWGSSVYHVGCELPMFIIACNFYPILQKLSNIIGIAALMPTQSLREFLRQLCRLDVFHEACVQVARMVLTAEPENFSATALQFATSKTMCGGSVQEGLHYIQLGLTDTFSKYDFGPKKNMKVYNSTVAPRFVLKRITSPVVIWCGPGDKFCNPGTIAHAVSDLPNVVSAKIIGRGTTFGHVDFLLSKIATEVVYIRTLKVLKSFL